MRGMKCVFLLSVAALTLPLAAQPVTVIDEDFDDLAIDGDIVGTGVIVDPGDGRGALLSLTQGENQQAGFAWFTEPLNLRENKVTISMDVYVRTGSSEIAADGMSIILQFGDDTSYLSGPGGGLGTANFPYEYKHLRGARYLRQRRRQ